MKNISRSLRRHHRERLKLRVLNWRFIGEPARTGNVYLSNGWRHDHRWYAGPLSWMTEAGHKHWRKSMMTRPARAKEHQALRLIRAGSPEHTAIRRWPDHKKPFVYYW